MATTNSQNSAESGEISRRLEQIVTDDIEVQVIEVQPTGVSGSSFYSDVAVTSLFQAYVHIINSERQVVWMRYNALLLSNSIIFAFLIRFLEVSRWIAFAGAVVGVINCIIWYLMTVDGWKSFRTYTAAARRFEWPGLPHANPFDAVRVIDRKASTRRRWIFRCALLTISIFGALYLGIAFIQLFLPDFALGASQ